MDQGTDAQVRHPGMGGGNSRGMLESYLTWRHGWPKRQTVKSRCQESLSKVDGRGSQIPGRPGTSTSDKEASRKTTSPSLVIHHKKPEDMDNCHKNSRAASNNSHISNQGLYTNVFLAYRVPGQPRPPNLQLKVNISSTLWLFPAPGPWLDLPAWVTTSGQRRLRCGEQAPGLFMHKVSWAPELCGWHLPNLQTGVPSKSQQMGGSSSPQVLWSDPPPKHAFFKIGTVRVPATCEFL